MSVVSVSSSFTAIATIFATIVSVHAQEAPPAALQVQQVEVRANPNAYDPRRDDTAAKIVLNHDEIVKYGDNGLLDVLKRVPGVTVNRTDGLMAEVRIGGLGSGYTQVLLNGERLPDGFSIDSLAPGSVEKIEVMRAANAEYSTEAIAGTINIILKKAVKTGQRELKAGYFHGNGFSGPNADLQLSDKAGRLSYSITASAMHENIERKASAVEESFDLSGEPTMLRNSWLPEKGQFTRLNISPRLNWKLEGGDTLTSQSFISVNRFENRIHTLTSTPLGAPPPYPDLNTGLKNDFDLVRTDLNWDHKLESGSRLDLKLGATVSRNRNDLERIGADPDGKITLDSVIESEFGERGASSTGKYTNPLWEGHVLALGWEGGYTIRDDSRVQSDTGSDERFKGRVARLAMYAQDEWTVTPQWSVYLGARWEGIRTNTSGNTFDAGRSRSSVFSPMLQTLWKQPGNTGDQVRFALARTYKAPTLEELSPRRRVTRGNNSANEPDLMGNPGLQPELALGLDASYEHYWGEGALFSLRTSMRRIEDYIGDLVFQDAGGQWIRSPVNKGRARTRSLELEVKFPLKLVMDDAPALDLRASVSRNWSKVDSVPGPDNRLDMQAPLSATLGFDYTRGALTTGSSLVYSRGYDTRLSERQAAYQIPRRDLEAYVLWKFDPKYQLRVMLTNLTGQDFIMANRYMEDDGLARRRQVWDEAPMVNVRIETKF